MKANIVINEIRDLKDYYSSRYKELDNTGNDLHVMFEAGTAVAYEMIIRDLESLIERFGE